MLVSSLSVSFAPQLVSRPCVSSSCVRMSAGDSYLSKVPMGPPDAILGIAEAFKASTVPGKVNVAIGAYRDDQGSPWVLPAVRAAEAKLIERGENKEYAGIVGLPGFLKVRVRVRVSS
jgi:aspartate aminotransferase, mitochondrial